MISSDTRTGDVLAIVGEGKFNVADTAGNSLKKYLFECMIGYQKHELDRLAEEDEATKGIVGNNPPIKEYVGYMRNYRGNTSVVNTVSRNFQNYNFNVKYPEPYEATQYGDSYYLSKGCIGQWNFTETTNVCNPLIQTKWGQGWPYNLSTPFEYTDGTIGEERLPLCHTTKAGCVAIAVSQIMAYHNYPATYPPKLRYTGFTYIETIREFLSISYMNTNEERYKLANFIRAIGDILNNDWGYDGTSASTSKIPGCFERMGYIKPEYEIPYNNDRIIKSLKQKRPVLIYGASSPTSAHEWIIDGYVIKQVGYDYFYFDENAKYTKNVFQQWIKESEQHYLNCNYGWNGEDNGFYLDKLFITTHYNYDPTSLKIIPDIHK